jgi:hypothetical protein
MASSLVELYFSYRETQRAILRVERAKAVAAAVGIEQFLKEVEQQVRETTRTRPTIPTRAKWGKGSSDSARVWGQRWRSSASSISSGFFAMSRL